MSEQSWVGKTFVPSGQQSSLPSDKIVTEDEVKALGKEYRVIGPNDMVTMDFKEDRLNVRLDANNVVTNVNYG